MTDGRWTATRLVASSIVALVLLGASLSSTAQNAAGIDFSLPSDIGPDTSEFSRFELSYGEALDIVKELGKYGESPPTEAQLAGTAISVAAMAYPPAGMAIGAMSAFISMAAAGSGSDPVGRRLEQLSGRVADLERNVRSLSSQIGNIRSDLHRSLNYEKLQRLQARIGKIRALEVELRGRPEARRAEAMTASVFHELVELFHFDKDEDIWRWSDIQFSPTPLGKLRVQSWDPAFRPLPTYDVYAASLLLWMAAIEYEAAVRYPTTDSRWAENRQTYITNRYGPALLKHARFLSLRPEWLDVSPTGGEPARTLPEKIARGIHCTFTPVTRMPTAGSCNASTVCNDFLARRRSVASSFSYPNPGGEGICTLPEAATGRPDEATLERLRAELRAKTANRYGTESLTAWTDWNNRFRLRDPGEEQLERAYGLLAMAELADRLVRLEQTGASEVDARSFDLTTYRKQFLYAIKPDGALTWTEHVVAYDRNAPPASGEMARRTQSTVGVTGSAAGAASPAAAAGTTAVPGATIARMGRRPRVTSPQVQEVVHYLGAPLPVGSAWQDFSQVIPGGIGGGPNNDSTILFAITPGGVLRWYRHDGFASGSSQWQGGLDVGSGWNGFQRVFGGGDGILYAIEPGGRLLWYRLLNAGNPVPQPQWSGPQAVGTGWAAFRHVFSTGQGIVYAVTDDGRLLWYRHAGYQDGTATWEGPRQIGIGWSGLRQLFSPGEGLVYAIHDDGRMAWFENVGFQDGTPRWIGPMDLGAKWWGDFRAVIPRMWGTPVPVGGVIR